MKYAFIIAIFFFFQNCSKPKTVLICGDHICINKAEAEQFFEENLTIEVKIIDKRKKIETDLVKLNLKENSNSKKKITIEKKSSTQEVVKVLSNDEIKKIKKDIKKKKSGKKIAKKIVKKEENKLKVMNKNKKILKEDIKENPKRNVNNKSNRKEVVDICTIIEKCSIEEISKFLLKQGKKKIFLI